MNIDNSFTYHAPKENQIPRYEALRSKAKELAELIRDTVPASPEQTLAIRELEASVMWANKAIACNE